MPILGVVASSIKKGDYYSIQSTVASGSETSIDFSTIPSTYSHLQLRMTMRDSRSAIWDSVKLVINGDNGGNYQYYYIESPGTGSPSMSADGSSAQPAFYFGYATSANADTNMFGVAVIDILDYTSTNKNKSLRALGGGSTNSSGDIAHFAGYWNNTNAITSLSVVANQGNWVAGSTFALYGIKTA